jgi:hypothetical protein
MTWSPPPVFRCRLVRGFEGLGQVLLLVGEQMAVSVDGDLQDFDRPACISRGSTLGGGISVTLRRARDGGRGPRCRRTGDDRAHAGDDPRFALSVRPVVRGASRQ